MHAELGEEPADVTHYMIAIAAVNGIDLCHLGKDLSAILNITIQRTSTEFLQKTANTTSLQQEVLAFHLV